MLGIRVTSKTNSAAEIRDAISNQIRNGTLLDGEKLPSIRALAAEIGAAPGTVARAYTQLEEAGLVESRPRLGTRVVNPAFAGAELASAARDFARAARGAGLEKAEALEMVSRFWED